MMKQHDKKESILDLLEFYGPIVFSIIVALSIICCFNDFYKSKNFSDALTSCITIVSIFIGLYSAIMPIIFSMKNDNKLYKKVLENKLYKKYLIYGAISGFVCIFISFLLYFNDLYNVKYTVIISWIWVFLLSYFISSNIRVAVVTVYMLLSVEENDKVDTTENINNIKKSDENKKKAIEYFKKNK